MGKSTNVNVRVWKTFRSLSGLIGVVARPAGGVADLASNTFEGIRNTTTGTGTINKSRETRAFYADAILQPYNSNEAECFKIFHETDKGTWSRSDVYMRHLYPVNGRNYLILTNKRIMHVRCTDLFNEWICDWNLLLSDIDGGGAVQGDSLRFDIKAKETHQVLRKHATYRKVQVPSGASVTWFLDKLQDMKLL